jgi:putative drug exporter of the RND superfamily
MLAALTLMPAFMGTAGRSVRSLADRRAERRAAQAGAAGEAHEQSAFARWGRKFSERPWP